MPNQPASQWLLLDVQERTLGAMSVGCDKSCYSFKHFMPHAAVDGLLKVTLAEVLKSFDKGAVDIAVTVPDAWVVHRCIEMDVGLRDQDVLDLTMLERGKYFT